MTVMLFLIVTAVGRFGVFRSDGSDGRDRLICWAGDITGSGTTMVPYPRGFFTFLILIWMGGSALMTWSIVKW